MKYPRLASIKECTGCLSCIDSCPTSSLQKIINQEGHYFYQLNQESCIKCGRCEKACPIISKLSYTGTGNSRFFAAWAKQTELRKRSASGGVFAAIACYVLSNEGVVFGAANSGKCNVSHIYVENIDDLYRLQGSKYTASDTSECYKQAYSFLKQGRFVLFSGTGCQIAGLKSFLQYKHYSGKLLTIDLVCGGIPSRLLIEKWIDNEPYAVKKILSFRTKEDGWRSSGFLYNMKVLDVNEKEHSYKGIKNLVTDGFCSELTNRYSCYNCKFNGLNRLSDFTIGDLWGDNLYKEEHKMGVSLLIGHNDQSQQFLQGLDEFLEIRPCDKSGAIKHNPRIANGYSYKKYMPERVFMAYLFEHLSYNSLKKIYAYDFSKYSLWNIYKAFRFLIDKIFK